MGLHCHQPVDNFGHIFEGAYKKSYEPFLSVLERHPRIKLSLHYSGSVLDWLLENKPDFIRRIKKLVRNGRVELLTGGYYEPILSMVPPRDAEGQIKKHARFIKDLFDCEPRGIWLTERVWDPSLIAVFRNLGLKYTIIDDYHLKCAGLKENEIFDRYALKGFNDFSVFASVKKLRYTMPFRETNVTMDFLSELKAKGHARFVTFADDCEKFGFWPHTYNWVYKKGWLDKFFGKLEENDWIKTMTFTEALAEPAPSGEIEIPHSSYEEMMAWCGGNFNNFFQKYPESGLMRKRMLLLSESLRDKEKGPENADNVKKAKEELYKAQSNCTYWHGIFGGIYLNFLRHGIYGHIIKSENILEKNSENTKPALFGNNSENVICAKNKFLTLFIDTGLTGSFFEIDYNPLFFNIVNTLARRYEPYHEKLKKNPKPGMKDLKKKVDDNTSIDLYEVLGLRDRNLMGLLAYDAYPRFSGLCHVMEPGTSLTDFINAKHVRPEGNSLFGPYRYKTEEKDGRLTVELEKDGSVSVNKRTHELRIKKCVIMERASEIFIKFDLENISKDTAYFIFGMEFNWSLEDASFMKKKRMKDIKEITLADRFNGLKINHILNDPMNFWSFPVYTLNESERGLGKTFQEVSLLFHKKVSVKKAGKISVGMRIKVSG